LARRDEFLEIGGFDEAIFLYYEDFDLSRAYAARGLPILSTSSVTVDHAGQGSSPRDEDVMISWALMGLLEQTAKWDGTSDSRRAARWIWSLLSAIALVANGAGHLPWFGSRSRQKAVSARRVQELLRHASAESGIASHYARARTALEFAQ